MRLVFKTTVQKYAFITRLTRGFPENCIGETLINQREGYIHHVGEVVLTLLGSRFLTREDMVGNGADAQGTIA